MTTLLMQFAAPLQAWGTDSRFAYRFSDAMPSKSAVIGLLAAARGSRRTDPIEELLSLEFGVRCDQPGTMVRDFQTARALDDSYSLPLTYRFYLGDAVFVAGVKGDTSLIEGLVDALRRPAFPLYLGRRSCPPSRPLFLQVKQGGSLREALRQAEWQAAAWYRRRQPQSVRLEIVRDAGTGDVEAQNVADLPLSFDPHHRRFGMRAVTREWCEVTNNMSRAAPRPTRSHVTAHSPMDMWNQEMP